MFKKIKQIFPPPLKNRICTEELMDDAQTDRQALFATLDQFVLINRLLTRSRTLLARYFVADMRRRKLSSATLMDIGAGGCDLSAWLIGYCARRGISLSVTCVDHDPRVVAYADKHYGELSGLEIKEMDARELVAGKHRYDYVFANHFLHHLDDEDIAPMLRLVDSLCKYRYLINDLQRSTLSYIGYSIGAYMFLHDSFAYTDGRISICRGFTRKELVSFCKKAGLKKAKVGRIIPGRLFIYR